MNKQRFAADIPENSPVCDLALSINLSMPIIGSFFLGFYNEALAFGALMVLSVLISAAGVCRSWSVDLTTAYAAGLWAMGASGAGHPVVALASSIVVVVGLISAIHRQYRRGVERG